jgi:hypothetical protein
VLREGVNGRSCSDERGMWCGSRCRPESHVDARWGMRNRGLILAMDNSVDRKGGIGSAGLWR